MIAKLAGSSDWSWFERELRALYAPRNLGTWRGHRRALALMRGEFARPEEISIEGLVAIRERLLRQGLRVVSVNSTLRLLRVQCGMLHDFGVISFHPFKMRSSLLLRESRSDRETTKRHLTISEAVTVLRQADQEYQQASGLREKFVRGRLRALVYLLAYTGVRASEALYLRRKDIHWERRTISITDEHHSLKTLASKAEVGIGEPGLAVLAEWSMILDELGYTFVFPSSRADSPWRDGKQEFRPAGMMRALGDRAGVAGVTPKVWRHTVATQLRQRFGASAEQVKTQLRHSNTETQLEYDHRDSQNLREIAEMIRY